MSAGVELERYADRSIGTIDGNGFSDERIKRMTRTEVEKQCKAWREESTREHEARAACMDRAHQTRRRGDRTGAEPLFDEANAHRSEADKYDGWASHMFLVFNNKDIGSDMIDLHGQQVDETKTILTARMREDQENGHDHLHVIVGQGHHSKGGIQRIKPAVEKLCEGFGLRCKTEENEGRIYIDLRGGRVPPSPAQSPTQHTNQQHGKYNGGHQQQHHPTHQQQHYATHQQQHYPAQQHQQQHYNQQSQEEEQYDEVEKLLTKLIKKYCCTVM